MNWTMLLFFGMGLAMAWVLWEAHKQAKQINWKNAKKIKPFGM